MNVPLSSYVRKAGQILRNRDNWRRCAMLDLAMDFVRHNQVEGDYFEFGVYAGRTFQYAYHAAHDRGLKTMKFHAFDSFEGFSEPKGQDDIGLIAKGSRSASEELFLSNIQKAGVPLTRVTTTKGWFSDTLEGTGAKRTGRKFGQAKAAVVWLDADLHEPTISALRFISNRLQDGTVLIFDNWFLFKDHPSRGEQKALGEWQKQHPEIILTPFYNVSWHGRSFIVSLPIDNN